MDTDFHLALRRALDGLLYTSESDAPWEAVMVEERGALTKERIRELVASDSDERIEVVSLDDFFSDLVKEQKWHDEDDARVTRRYRDLLSILKNNLRNAQVFKVGSVEVSIFVLGETAEGKVAGIKTVAVET